MKNRRAISGLIWVIIFICMSNMGVVSALFQNTMGDTQITQDAYMNTQSYNMDIVVGEDNSYTVTEHVNVDFTTYRHGIYRYIPTNGDVYNLKDDGTIKATPYYASTKFLSTNTEVDRSKQGGNVVYKFGNADNTVLSGNYEFSYKQTPYTTNGYEDIYYNIYSGKWQDDIPAGSEFTIAFPKEFDHEMLKFYYGEAGSDKDAGEILTLSWEGDTVKGVLNETLPFGSGLTVYAPVEAGYFSGAHTTIGFTILLVLLALVPLVVVFLLFLIFGRDEQLIPSIQFQPPQGLDSAAVGYIIDGSVDDRDITSLIVYWADKGYLKIKDPKEKNLSLVKAAELPSSSQNYERTLFEGIFGKKGEVGKEVKVSSLKYKMANRFTKAKGQLKSHYKQQLYTGSSKVAQVLGVLLSAIPFVSFVGVTTILSPASFGNKAVNLIFVICYLVGMILLVRAVDSWYARSGRGRRLSAVLGAGLSVCAVLAFAIYYTLRVLSNEVLNFLVPMALTCIVSLGMVFMVAFMKKRTHQCVEWMGYLVGLREFIETAELERMQMMAQTTPELFYHILPYAYVFGLSDVFMRKMEALHLPGPDWFQGTSGNMTMFDYYLMHRLFYMDLNTMSANMTAVKVEHTSGGSSFGGGSFGGGSFGGGGGGFSGGGFGGGGGGSW